MKAIERSYDANEWTAIPITDNFMKTMYPYSEYYLLDENTCAWVHILRKVDVKTELPHYVINGVGYTSEINHDNEAYWCEDKNGNIGIAYKADDYIKRVYPNAKYFIYKDGYEGTEVLIPSEEVNAKYKCFHNYYETVWTSKYPELVEFYKEKQVETETPVEEQKAERKPEQISLFEF